MELSLFAVHDRVSRSFGNPFTSVNQESAMRAVSYEVQHVESSMLFNHPADFELVYLGCYDTNTGAIAREELPVVVCSLASLVKPADAISVANRAGTVESQSA